MKWIIFILLPTQLLAQSLSYTPGKTISKTIDKSYYNTDYINFTYSGLDTVELAFELIEDSAKNEWHRALCTHLICYTNMPSDGYLSNLTDGDQGYLAISLSTSNQLGAGSFKYRVYSTSIDTIDDTLTFKYEILNSEEILDQPWVKINFQQNVVFVLFKNAQLKSSIEIFNLSGHLITNQEISGTFSYSLANLNSGVYIVRIKSENGQEEIKKIVKT